jgi:hypothetical protein
MESGPYATHPIPSPSVYGEERITLAEAVKRYGIDSWHCRVEHRPNVTTIYLEKHL